MKRYGKEAIVKIGGKFYYWSYVWGLFDADVCRAIDDGGDRSPQEYVDAYADYIAEKFGESFADICAVELQPLEKTRVDYAGGCSRSGSHAVDYMRVEIAGIELYAEAPVPDDDTPEKESARYDLLVDEIDREAIKNAFHRSCYIIGMINFLIFVFVAGALVPFMPLILVLWGLWAYLCYIVNKLS